MSIDIAKIIELKSKIKLEQIYNFMVIFIITVILVLATVALYRPVNIMQFNNVMTLAQQQNLPQTQEMALSLIEQRVAQQQIHVGQYLKLMHAYQLESVRAHQLPALSIDSPHTQY